MPPPRQPPPLPFQPRQPQPPSSTTTTTTNTTELPPPPPPRPPPLTFRTRLRSAIWLVLPFYLAATTAITLKDTFAEITLINGSSMSPSLSPDHDDGTPSRDLVLFRKIRPTRPLARGDVVFFHAPHKPDGMAVKRVVALGGDTVVLDGRRRPRDVENGRVNERAKSWDRYGGQVVVPPGHLWVEGDNWRKTMDSNDYGPISRSLVSGVAWRLVWPWRMFGTKPWEGFQNGTRVVEGPGDVKREEAADLTIWEPHG